MFGVKKEEPYVRRFKSTRVVLCPSKMFAQRKVYLLNEMPGKNKETKKKSIMEKIFVTSQKAALPLCFVLFFGIIQGWLNLEELKKKTKKTTNIYWQIVYECYYERVSDCVKIRTCTYWFFDRG